MTEENVFISLNHIYESIFSTKFFIMGDSNNLDLLGFQEEIFIMQQLSETVLKLRDASEIGKLYAFIEAILPALYITMFVDTFNVATWVEVLNQTVLEDLCKLCFFLKLLIYCESH